MFRSRFVPACSQSVAQRSRSDVEYIGQGTVGTCRSASIRARSAGCFVEVSAPVNRRAFASALLVTGTFALVPDARRVACARNTATPEPVAKPSRTLLSVELGELPPPPAFLRLVRIVLQPGAAVPMHSHPGPEIGVIEHGVVTVETAAAVAVATASGERVVIPESGATFDLASGDQVVYPAGTAFGFRNDGDRPAAILTVVILPAGAGRPPGSEWVNGAPGADAMSGVSSVILGDAAAPGWPAAPFTLQLDAIVLEPGDSLPGWPGPVLIAVDKGQVGFTLLGGEFQLSGNGKEPEARSGEGQEQLVPAGAAVFFPGGMNDVPRDAQQGSATVIRLGVSSTGAAAAGPAATPWAGIAQSATPAGGEFSGAGAAVTSDDGVRLREEPSTGADVVAELPGGTAIVVIGEAVEAEGFAWFPVALADDASVTGYIAAPGLAAAP